MRTGPDAEVRNIAAQELRDFTRQRGGKSRACRDVQHEACELCFKDGEVRQSVGSRKVVEQIEVYLSWPKEAAKKLPTRLLDNTINSACTPCGRNERVCEGTSDDALCVRRRSALAKQRREERDITLEVSLHIRLPDGEKIRRSKTLTKEMLRRRQLGRVVGARKE